MRIAQVAPLIEPVPPRLYGGTERVVSWLTNELVELGHEVTLFASGDSRTAAELRSVRHRSVRLDPDMPDPVAYHLLELEDVFNDADQFDIIHCHLDFLAFPFSKSSAVPTIHTLHGRLDLPHWPPILDRYPEVPLISISNDQRKPLDVKRPNWVNTIYHGLPASCIAPGTGKGEYLAFFSRLSREKRPDVAIEIAKRTGIPIKIAGKIDVTDRPYFEEVVEPLLHHPLVEFLGEMGDEKVDFLGDALCLLFPIDWPEPFGLVMIEAMACGTPVIARPLGSVPEVIDHGRTGFIVDTVDEMVKAVKRVGKINRQHCVETVKERFCARVMAARYEGAYEKLINGKKDLHLVGAAGQNVEVLLRQDPKARGGSRPTRAGTD